VTDTSTSEQVGTLSGVVGQTATLTISPGQVVNPGDALHVWVGGITNPSTVPSPQPTISVWTSSDPRPVQSGALAITAAKSVSGVSITNVGATSGTGSTTGYSVDFTTSSTGSMASSVGSTITVTFPAGFNASPISCYSQSGCTDVITDVNSGEVVGSLTGSGTTVTGTLAFGPQSSVNAGDTLQLTLVGVVNSMTASTADTVSVMTSSDDGSAVKSNSFSVVASHAAGTPTLTLSPTAAAGALTGYVATFALSSTGGLSGSNGSSVTVNLPSSATFTFSGSGASLFDQTTGQVLTGYGAYPTVSGSSITIPLTTGAVANPGDVIAATVDGVKNPATAGSYSVSVQTSSDTTSPASNAVTVGAQKSISAVTVKNTGPTSAAGARTGYAVSFTTSSTGNLSGQVGSTVAVAFPTGFGVASTATNNLIDTTTGQVVGMFFGSGTTSAEAMLEPGAVVQGGDTLTGYIEGVTNSTLTSTTDTVSISTSSDKPAASGTFSVTAASPVTSVTNVLAGPTDAAGAATGYTITFKTPTSGGLSPAVGSSVTIGLPSGFTSGSGSWSILDKTTNVVVGSCFTACYLAAGPLTLSSPVAGGDTLLVTLHGVVDSSTPGTANKFSVSTTSSPSVVTASSGVTVVAAQPVLSVAVTDDGPSDAAGAQTDYTVSFKTSSTGALSPSDGATVTIAFPTGFSSSLSGYTVRDTTSGRTIAQCSIALGFCFQYWSPGSPIPLTGAVAAGDTLAVTIDAVKNGPAATTDTVSVSTSSDPTRTTSLAFTVVAASAVSHPTVSVAPSSAGGALTGWTVRFTTSSTGGLSGAAQSSVTLDLPSGASVPCIEFHGYVRLVDTITGTTVGGQYLCGFGNAVSIALLADSVVHAGDALAVYLEGVVNPADPGTYHVGVQTSSDTTQVVSANFSVVAPNTVATPKLSMTVATHGQSSVYTLTFATSKSGGLSARVGSDVNLVLPQGTGVSGASWSITDVTSENSLGSGFIEPSGNSTEDVLALTQGSASGGDTLQLVLTGVTNPAAGSYTLTVSTTSDWYDVPTAAYTIS
jgi:hypothetical protein